MNRALLGLDGFTPKQDVRVVGLGYGSPVNYELPASKNASRKFAATPIIQRDVPPNPTQLNTRLKQKLGHQFEIAGHFRNQTGRYSNLAFGIDGERFYAESSERQATVKATSPDKVVLAHKDVPDHGAYSSALLKSGEKLVDKNTIFDLPTLQPFPFVKPDRAAKLVESFIAAAQLSPRLAALLKELGEGSTKINLATSGRPYQDKKLGHPVFPTVYVNGPVDVVPTFVPAAAGMGGHFTVMPKIKDGVTLYMPHSDSGYSVEAIEYAVNLLHQALSGQRLNLEAAAQELNNTYSSAD